MPYPRLLHSQPLPLQQSAADSYRRRRHSDRVLAQSLWGLWVLVHTRFVWASLAGMGFDSKCYFTPSSILLGFLLCPWTWGIFCSWDPTFSCWQLFRSELSRCLSEFCMVLYILFLWSGTPVHSQLVFCIHFCVGRCIPDVSVERDVLSVHLLLHHLVFPIDRETMETVRDFTLGGSKITANGDCSYEIKRHLLLGRKVMNNLDRIFKSRDINLPTKVHLVKSMFFPIVMDVRVGL